jgi:hypothetical protein
MFCFRSEGHAIEGFPADTLPPPPHISATSLEFIQVMLRLTEWDGSNGGIQSCSGFETERYGSNGGARSYKCRWDWLTDWLRWLMLWRQVRISAMTQTVIEWRFSYVPSDVADECRENTSLEIRLGHFLLKPFKFTEHDHVLIGYVGALRATQLISLLCSQFAHLVGKSGFTALRACAVRCSFKLTSFCFRDMWVTVYH